MPVALNTRHCSRDTRPVSPTASAAISALASRSVTRASMCSEIRSRSRVSGRCPASMRRLSLEPTTDPSACTPSRNRLRSKSTAPRIRPPLRRPQRQQQPPPLARHAGEPPGRARSAAPKRAHRQPHGPPRRRPLGRLDAHDPIEHPPRLHRHRNRIDHDPGNHPLIRKPPPATDARDSRGHARPQTEPRSTPHTPPPQPASASNTRHPRTQATRAQ